MNKITIGKKLYLSFAAMIVLMLVLGSVSIYRLAGITDTFVSLQTEYSQIADLAMESQIELLTARRHEKDFIARNDPKYLERMDKTIKSFEEHSLKLKDRADSLSLAEIANQSQQMAKDMLLYQASFNEVVNLIKAQGDKEHGIRGDMRKYAHQLEEAIKTTASADMMVDYLLIRRHEKDFILRHDTKYVDKAHEVIKNLEKRTRDTALNQTEAEAINTNAKAYLGSFEKLSKNVVDMKTQYPIMREAAHKIEDESTKIKVAVNEIITSKQSEAIAQKKATILFLFVLCAFVVLVGIGLSLFSVRVITKPLNKVIEGMNEGATQVASASSQVSSSSQSLAEGASEQAASIEETSSSLEEMSSMTNQNADNANQADNLMTEANQVVGRANTSMTDLTQSMEEISLVSVVADCRLPPRIGVYRQNS